MVRCLCNLTLRISMVAVALLVASPSLADIERESSTDSAPLVYCQSVCSTTAPDVETNKVDGCVERTSPPDARLTDVLPIFALSYSSTPASVAPAHVVRELPAGPGGAMLFLMGVGCVGAVKLGKSVRSLHLQSLPDWYHADGPLQIGHVTAINPDLTAPATISICDLPVEQSIQLLSRRATPLCLRSQCAAALATSRAPPLL